MATDGMLGKVVQIQGGVVDVEFPAGALPDIYHALEIDRGRLFVENPIEVLNGAQLSSRLAAQDGSQAAVGD